MKRIGIYALGLLLLALSACNRDDCLEPSGDRLRFEKTLERFNTIELALSANAFIEIDTALEEPELLLITNGNIEDEIITEVRNNRLVLDIKSCIDNNNGIEFHITTPELDALIASSSGDIYSSKLLETDSLFLQCTDDGNIDVLVNTPRLVAESRRAGDLRIEGYTPNFSVQLNGSGDLYAFSLPADTADVLINSSGNARVRVLNELNVQIKNSGDVLYKGAPFINSQIEGSGSLIDEN